MLELFCNFSHANGSSLKVIFFIDMLIVLHFDYILSFIQFECHLLFNQKNLKYKYLNTNLQKSFNE